MRLGFTIRDLLWMTALVAMGQCRGQRRHKCCFGTAAALANFSAVARL